MINGVCLHYANLAYVLTSMPCTEDQLKSRIKKTQHSRENGSPVYKDAYVSPHTILKNNVPVYVHIQVLAILSDSDM